MRLASVVSDAEVIVVKAPTTAGEQVASGGLAMVSPGTTAERATAQADLDEPLLLGKRYVDATSGLELLCTKQGIGTLTIAGRVLVVKEAKALPPSD
jgi:hypothetical protein